MNKSDLILKKLEAVEKRLAKLEKNNALKNGAL